MSRVDRLVLLGVTAVAALLRLPGIEARGRFDADQGHDMLTLVAFTRDGVIPLLGPRTSVGEFHHGALYYFLLAPAAAVSNGDPVAVTVFIALLGIGAVALTWWLARAIGGPLAGAIAGVLMAVSPAGIEQSTFIWNPNPIAFFAVLALAAAWRARTVAVPVGARVGVPASGARSGAWWALAIGSAGVVTQLHVLGVVFLVAIVALAALQGIRGPAGGRGPAVRGLAGGLALMAVLYLPLVVHELQTGFLETRRVLDYLSAGDEPLAGGPVSALVFTLLRVVGWPLVGVVTDVPAAAAVLLAVTLGLAALGLRQARGDEATALRWLLGTLAWSTIVLAVAAPSLQRVVEGLPNDHYHAYLDPVVILLIALPVSGLLGEAWRRRAATHGAWPAAASLVLAAGVAALVATALTRMPPLADPDGGWPAMRAAGERIVATTRAAATGGEELALLGLPAFKLPDAVGFPIRFAGGAIAADGAGAPWIVVACDRLFEAAIGAACGGPAEDSLVGAVGAGGPGAPVGQAGPVLVERFAASPRTWISVYRR